MQPPATAPPPAERRPQPADGLLSAVGLAGMALLAVNDHWLKVHHASWWTGKLSDVAGMLFFPLLLQALVEASQVAVHRYRGPSRTVLVLACVASAVGLSAINLWPVAAAAWSGTIGALQWPVLAAWGVLTGSGVPALRAVTTVADPTDVWAAPAVLLAGWAGWRRTVA